MKRLPHSTCMLCHRQLDEVGGRRLGPGSSAFNGMRLSDSEKLINRAEPERAVAIDETEDGFRSIIIWGDRWTDELIEEAKAVVEAGRQPWMCQECGNRVCSECGAILKIAQGAETVHDDGTMKHQMIVPTDKTCSNRECAKNMEYSPRGWRDPA